MPLFLVCYFTQNQNKPFALIAKQLDDIERMHFDI